MEFKKALINTIIWKTLNTIFAFCINLLIVRILGSENSGSFFYSIAILSFITLLTSLCLENGITYYGSKNNAILGSLYVFIFVILLLQGLISWGILYFFKCSIGAGLAWLLILGYLSINYFTALYSAKKWFISSNVILFTGHLFILLVLMLQYFGIDLSLGKYHFNVPEVFTGGIVMQALLLMLYFVFFSGVNKKITVQPALFYKDIIGFSSVIFLSNLILFLVMRVDYYFTEKFCSDIALSNYIQVSKMGQMLLLIPAMIATVIFPFTSGGNKKEMALQTIRVSRILILIFFIAALIIGTTGYWVFPWLFGKAFDQMYLPMLLLLPGILCLTILTTVSAYLDGIKKIWLAVAANSAALILIIIADYIFIPQYGIKAAATVSSLGYFVCTAVSLYWFLKFSNTSLLSFFKWERSDLDFIKRRS